MRTEAVLVPFQLRTELHKFHSLEILRHDRIRHGEDDEVARRGRRDVKGRTAVVWMPCRSYSLVF